jgi:hypothetical protein
MSYPYPAVPPHGGPAVPRTTPYTGPQDELRKIFYARVHANEDPLYGQIMMTRFRDHMIVTCAPTVALINPEVLFHDRAVGVRVHDDMIELADQATYRITGWDRERRALIVLLEGDHR